MTSAIHDDLHGSEMKESWEKVLSHVTDDGSEMPNVEDMLSHVRGLLRYAGDGKVRGLEKSDLSSLEESICARISKMVDVDLPDEDSGYHDLATWLGAIDRKEPVEIFTTNYDMLLEQALEEFSIPYFDGFVGGYKPFFDAYSVLHDDLPTRWLRLWKIHGSVNWTSRTEDGAVRIWRSDRAAGEKALIHPSHMKYDQSRKMPYLALIDRLQKFLQKPRSVLFVVGYSFGDEHLNDVLLQSLQGSPSTAVFAFMYGDLCEHEIARKLAVRRSNFSLFARDAAVINTRVREWARLESEPTNETFGVRWVKVDDEESTWGAEVLLGDFQKFGQFFRSVTGHD